MDSRSKYLHRDLSETASEMEFLPSDGDWDRPGVSTPPPRHDPRPTVIETSDVGPRSAAVKCSKPLERLSDVDESPNHRGEVDCVDNVDQRQPTGGSRCDAAELGASESAEPCVFVQLEDVDMMSSQL